VQGSVLSTDSDRSAIAILVKRAQSGERAAWDELVERLARLVWSVTLGFDLSPADSEDVVQIVWMRLAENLERLRDPGGVKSWVATTARRESITLLRQRARVTPVDLDELPEPASAPPADEPVLERARDRAVWFAFGQLPQRCRHLLHLVVADRTASYETLAAALEMPIGSIGPTRQRCLERLRVLLGAAGITSLSDASV
jgi:RNA polymerase sigma factor (sigma-70 family)